MPATTPTDFELQSDYRLAPSVTGQYNGWTYGGGETIEVNVVYPDFETAAADTSHTLLISMGSMTFQTFAGPSCYDPSVGGTPYREVDDWQVLGWVGSAVPDFEGMGTCYVGSAVYGWIN
jgi:hypothetical protein